MVMNMIGRDGAVSIVKILPSKPNFRRLELDENQISEEGIEEIQVGDCRSVVSDMLHENMGV